MKFYDLVAHPSTRAVYYYAGKNPRYAKSCIVVSYCEPQCRYHVTFHLLEAGEIVATHPGAPVASMAEARRMVPSGYVHLNVAFGDKSARIQK